MTLKYFKLTLFSLFFFTGILSAAKPVQKEKSAFSLFQKESPAYLFSYSTLNGEDGLHLVYSHDGIVWRSINHGNTLVKPTIGTSKTMTEPCIAQDAEGIFHMVWNTGSNNSIGYATSKDLINWSEQKELPVMSNEPTVTKTCSPELYYDKLAKTFHLMWASTIPGRFPETEKTEDGFNNRLYSTTTTDFNTFTKTKMLFNPEFSVSEACYLKNKGSYYIFFTNDLDKNIQYATSGRIKSFSSTVSEPINGKKMAKGPTTLQIGDYLYVYWENFMDKKIGGVRSKNIKKAIWEDVTDVIHFPAGVKQGSAFKVSNDILIGLQALEKASE